MENLRIPVIVFFIAFIIVCVLAIAGIVIWDTIERRRFEKSIRLNRKDYLAETMMIRRRKP